MAALLSSVSSGIQMKPLRCVITGHEGVGKTTLAAGAPDPIFVTTEDGLGLIDAPSIPTDSHAKTNAILDELIAEDHSYRTLVFDAIDGEEPNIFSAICEAGNKSSIGDFGFNKGYVQADDYWARLFHKLDHLRATRSMNIVIISHVSANHIDDPVVGTYVRYEPNLHKRTVPLLTKWADLIGFLAPLRSARDEGDDTKNRTVRVATNSRQRFLHVSDDGRYIAKNRFGLTEPIEIPQTNGWSALSQAVAAQFAAAKGTTTTKEQAA